MPTPGPLSGALTALVTPFRDRALDRDALVRLVERQIAAGIDGLVPCGTTGEAPTLSYDEHRDVIAWTVQAAAGRVPVVAGIGSNDTAKARDNALRAQDAGATALLATAPYYNKPTQAGLVAHFTAVADAVPGCPVVLYDVPGRTSVRLSRQTILTLAQHDNIVALKDATGDLVHAAALARDLPDGFSLLSGDDATTFPFVCVGGHGCISVLSNVLPAETAALVRQARAGALAEARAQHLRLLVLMEDLFIQTNPLPVKAALAELGLLEESYRLPLVPMDPAPRARFVASLREAGVLPG